MNSHILRFLPGYCRILSESIHHQRHQPDVQVFLEVPQQEDCVDLRHFAFAQIVWLPRQPLNAMHGECLLRAVKAQARLPQAADNPPVEEEPQGQLLWDKATSHSQAFYGWVAAESTVVKQLRRYITGECAVDRQTINFMAYWAKGRR